ncbi:hypothetical protein MUO66_09555, partial [Candidatus Bathyarchaeota archaeon]|nr:hypothetical protein [Candidatus Bathyarchaeota archaeon]
MVGKVNFLNKKMVATLKIRSKAINAARQWLNQNAPAGSVVLVDNRFRGLILTRFNLDGRYIITNPWSEKSPEA